MSDIVKPAASPPPPRRRARRRPEIDYGILPDLVGYHLRRAQVAVFQDFTAEMADTAVSPGQFGMLVLIAANEGLNQSALGEAMAVDRSTVVAVIDKLEALGWVERAPSPLDRRANALKLSPVGRDLVRRLTARVRAHEARITAGLSQAEQAELIRLLGRIADGG